MATRVTLCGNEGLIVVLCLYLLNRVLLYLVCILGSRCYGEIAKI